MQNNNSDKVQKIGFTAVEVNGEITFPSQIDIKQFFQDGVFDYTQCQFECRIEPYQKQPQKIFELKPNDLITWQFEKQKQQLKLSGFQIKQGKKQYNYLGEEVVLIKLKQIFCQKVFQAKFQDEYEIQTQVGKGNYARVYSAIHKSTGRKYAVKCFEKQKISTQDKGMLSLFNEIKVMRNLNEHDNVIKLIEVYEGQNNLYIVMEIVEGTSLYDEIKKHSQQPYQDNEIKSIFKMLVDGIAYCSQKNVMHRDLKPENILFARKGNQQTLKIVDFGLGTFADEYPYMFPKCGTPGFVAPEIANLVDKQSGYSVICDVFSAGVIFYILLTGEAVFPGKKFNEVLKKNKECIIDFQRKELENVSIDCKDLLMKMLDKDPSTRINIFDVQKHSYFQPTLKKSPSQEEIKYVDKISKEELPAIREKTRSLFVKPLRIPYLTKDGVSLNTEDQLNSFITRDPLFAGQTRQKSDSSSGGIYYTVGSIDGQNQQQNQISNFSGQKEKSKFHQTQLQKTISEVQEEEDKGGELKSSENKQSNQHALLQEIQKLKINDDIKDDFNQI